MRTTSQAEVSDATRATSFSPSELARISASHAATGSAWERMRRQQRREFSVCRVAVPVRWRFSHLRMSPERPDQNRKPHKTWTDPIRERRQRTPERKMWSVVHIERGE